MKYLKPKLDFKLLIYDIETSHLKVRTWALGEQVIRHDQLLNLKSNGQFKILTITYKWYHEKLPVTLDCGNDGTNSDNMIKLFDDELKKADVVIGKNNHRFDDKRVNTARLMASLPGMPQWYYKSDDLETQIRKYFSFPSHSLDYLSNLFDLGGKVKMERQDWIDIEDYIEINNLKNKIKSKELKGILNIVCMHYYGKPYKYILKRGKESFNKMKFYNAKDSLDTEKLLIKILPYIVLKSKITAKSDSNVFVCVTCGSRLINAANLSYRNGLPYREFYCVSHKGYAGMRLVRKDAYHHWRFVGKMIK